MSLKEVMIRCFQTLLQSNPNKVNLDQAHTELTRCFKDPSSLFLLCDLVLASQSDTEAKLVLSIIHSYIKMQCSSISLDRKHNRSQISIQILNLMGAIKPQYRRILQRIYSNFLFAPANQKIRQSLTLQTIDNFSSLCSHLMKPGNNLTTIVSLLNKIDVQLSILSSILTGSLQSTTIKKMVSTLHLGLTNVLNFIAQLIVNKQEQFIPNLQRLLQLQKWLFLKVSTKQLTSLFSQLILDEKVCTLFKKVLVIQKEETVFTLLGKDDNSIKLNNCKCIVLQQIKICTKTIDEEKWWRQNKYNSFILLLKNVLEQLPILLNKQFDITENKQPLKYALKAFTYIVRLPCFHAQAIAVRDILLWQFCFPLLVPSEVTCADTFRSERQDMTQNNNIDKLGNSASCLIQSYAQFVDGSLTLILFGAINQIKSNVLYLQRGTESVSIFPNGRFMTTTSQQTQVECCLTAISLCSFLLLKRFDIWKLVEEMFIECQQFFCNQDLSATLIFHFFQTYAFYADFFYKLILNKTSTKQIHLRILNFCCKILVNIWLSKPRPISQMSVFNQLKIIASLDCLENCFIANNFIQSLFTEEQQKLFQLFDFMVILLKTEKNLLIVQVLIDLYKSQKIKCQRSKQSNLYNLAVVQQRVIISVAPLLKQKCPNDQLIKGKFLQLIELMTYCSQFPQQILMVTRPYFSFLFQSDFVWESVQLLCVIVKRFFNLTKDQQFKVEFTKTGFQILLQSLNWIKRHRQLKQFFDVMILLINQAVRHSNQNIVSCFRSLTGTLTSMLMEGLQLKRTSINFEDHLQDMINTLSYLLMNIAYVGCNHAPMQITALAQHLIINLAMQVQQLETTYHYTDHFPKQLAVCCSVLNRLHCVQLQVYTSVQIEFILRQLMKTQSFKDKAQLHVLALQINSVLVNRQSKELFETLCLSNHRLIYESNIDSQHQNDESSEDQEEMECWKYTPFSLNKNPFIQGLIDPITPFKDLCNLFKHNYSDWFRETINDLPEDAVTFLREIVMNYQGITRKLVKVKRYE